MKRTTALVLCTCRRGVDRRGGQGSRFDRLWVLPFKSPRPPLSCCAAPAHPGGGSTPGLLVECGVDCVVTVLEPHLAWVAAEHPQSAGKPSAAAPSCCICSLRPNQTATKLPANGHVHPPLRCDSCTLSSTHLDWVAAQHNLLEHHPVGVARPQRPHCHQPRRPAAGRLLERQQRQRRVGDGGEDGGEARPAPRGGGKGRRAGGGCDVRSTSGRGGQQQAASKAWRAPRVARPTSAACTPPLACSSASHAPALVQEALHFLLVRAVLVGGVNRAGAEGAQAVDQQQRRLGGQWVLVVSRLAHAVVLQVGGGDGTEGRNVSTSK